MITLTRRQALAAAIAAGLAQPALARRLQAAAGAVDAETLAAYLDVLLPADDLSPAASALGVPGELLALAGDIPLYHRLLALGTDWLNDTGRGPFHTLPEADRLRVVDWMSTADPDEIPGRFYQLVRYSAVELYYSRTEALAGLDLNAAPQPAGYPPPWP